MSFRHEFSRFGTRAALDLPPEERLYLARRLVESVVAPASLNETISGGIRRIEDLATGRVTGLTEEEYRDAVKLRVLFHPQFPKDVRRFDLEDAAISTGLPARFQNELSQALHAVKSSPTTCKL